RRLSQVWQNDALTVQIEKQIGGLLGQVPLLYKREADLYSGSAVVQAHIPIAIAGLIAIISADEKFLVYCGRRFLGKMPRRFAELSTVYSKAHELVTVEISRRLIRDGGSSFRERSVNSHLTHIFQDTRMDCPPYQGGVACGGFCGIGPDIVNPEFHPRRH